MLLGHSLYTGLNNKNNSRILYLRVFYKVAKSLALIGLVVDSKSKNNTHISEYIPSFVLLINLCPNLGVLKCLNFELMSHFARYKK